MGREGQGKSDVEPQNGGDQKVALGPQAAAAKELIEHAKLAAGVSPDCYPAVLRGIRAVEARFLHSPGKLTNRTLVAAIKCELDQPIYEFIKWCFSHQNAPSSEFYGASSNGQHMQWFSTNFNRNRVNLALRLEHLVGSVIKNEGRNQGLSQGHVETLPDYDLLQNEVTRLANSTLSAIKDLLFFGDALPIQRRKSVSVGADALVATTRKRQGQENGSIYCELCHRPTAQCAYTQTHRLQNTPGMQVALELLRPGRLAIQPKLGNSVRLCWEHCHHDYRYAGAAKKATRQRFASAILEVSRVTEELGLRSVVPHAHKRWIAYYVARPRLALTEQRLWFRERERGWGRIVQATSALFEPLDALGTPVPISDPLVIRIRFLYNGVWEVVAENGVPLVVTAHLRDDPEKGVSAVRETISSISRLVGNVHFYGEAYDLQGGLHFSAGILAYPPGPFAEVSIARENVFCTIQRICAAGRLKRDAR